MIRVKLRQAMNRYRDKTGERLTYEVLAERTGLSRATLESLGTREDYNARLSTIELLCTEFECDPGELLEWVAEGGSKTDED